MDSTCESLQGHVVSGAAEPNHGRCVLTCNRDESHTPPPPPKPQSARLPLRETSSASFTSSLSSFGKHRAGYYTPSITSLGEQSKAKVFQVHWKVCHSSCARACVCVYPILIGLPLSAAHQPQRCHHDSVIIGRDRWKGSLAKTNEMGRNRGEETTRRG